MPMRLGGGGGGVAPETVASETVAPVPAGVGGSVGVAGVLGVNVCTGARTAVPGVGATAGAGVTGVGVGAAVGAADGGDGAWGAGRSYRYDTT